MTKYTLLVKLNDNLDEDIINYYRTYKPTHKEDSGFDIPLPNSLSIFSLPIHKTYTINFNISCAMIDNENNLSPYYLYPRSSISKYPLMMANHIGIIDSGYRGNIMAKIRCLINAEVTLDKKTKLFQICSPDLSPFSVKIVEYLPDSSRGSGGFGSTGN